MKTLSRPEAAAFLKCDKSVVSTLFATGQLPGAKIGRRMVFIESDLEAYVEQSKILPDIPASQPIYIGAGVYFLFHKGEVVYVGVTNNILRRLGEHAKDKRFDAYSYIPIDGNEATELELKFIRQLKPRYNDAGSQRWAH